MADIPATVQEIAAGSCSDGFVVKGKPAPAGPAGSRQGLNDFTGWFAGNPDMAGDYLGYDGPYPPFNDERMHRYSSGYSRWTWRRWTCRSASPPPMRTAPCTATCWPKPHCTAPTR